MDIKNISYTNSKFQRVNFCKSDVYICASQTHSHEQLLGASREIWSSTVHVNYACPVLSHWWNFLEVQGPFTFIYTLYAWQFLVIETVFYFCVIKILVFRLSVPCSYTSFFGVSQRTQRLRIVHFNSQKWCAVKACVWVIKASRKVQCLSELQDSNPYHNMHSSRFHLLSSDYMTLFTVHLDRAFINNNLEDLTSQVLGLPSGFFSVVSPHSSAHLGL